MRTSLSIVLMLSASPCVLTAQLAPLHAPTVVLPVDSAPFQRLLDLDGDGDLDAVGTRVYSNSNRYQVHLWRNDGGVMTRIVKEEVVRPGIQAAGTRVATGDWNLDGRPDFFVCGGVGVAGGAGTVDLFLVEPSSTVRRIELATSSAFPVWSVDVASADFDVDGRADVAVFESPRSPGQGTARVEVHFARGGSTTIDVTATANGRLCVLDTDGDASPEFALYDSASFQPFRIVNGALVGLPALTTSIKPVSSMPYLWMAGDLDGDGDDDAVVFQPSAAVNFPPLYQVFRRTGPSTWIGASEAVGGPAEYLADIDGDGDLDGVCCGGGGGGQTHSWPNLDFKSTFEVTRNDGNGGFPVADAFPGAGSRSLAGVADLDGDGAVDLVAGRCIFFGRGPWSHHPMPPTGTNSIVMRRRFLTDADRDGDIDLMHNQYGGSRNRGDGTFATPRLPGVTLPPDRTTGGGFDVDFDGDGALDHVVPMFVRTPSPVFEAMALIRNNGGGTYRYAGPVTDQGVRAGWGYTVDHFARGDADGDGHEDLIANSNPTREPMGRFEIFWHRNGRYLPGPSFPSLHFEAVADFDRDGVPDLLVTAYGGGLRILPGTGNPTAPFGAAVPLPFPVPIAFRPHALLVADLNDDGRPDIAASTGVYPVLVFNLPGGFQVRPWTTVLTDNSEAFFTAADFDHDGRTDLVIGPLKGEPNVAMVLMAKANAAGGTREATDYEATRQVVPIGFAGDADGDGDQDLVGLVTVYNPHFGAQAGRRLQYGDGVPGEAGAVPLLGVAGPLRVGETHEFCLRGVPGPTTALVGFALGAARIEDFPLAGMVFRLDPGSTIVIPVAITESGHGRAAASFVQPYRAPAILAGAILFAQAVVLDPAAPGGASISNALAEQFGK